MPDDTYPEDALRPHADRALDRWADTERGEVLRLPKMRAEWDLAERAVLMRFAWTGADGLPPIDTYGSMVYPSAFGHIDYGVPLARNHNHDAIIGSGQVAVRDGEAWIRGRLGGEDGGKAERQMEMLLSSGANLECSVGMRPSTAVIRRGDELTDAEAAAFEAAGWPRGMGWAIDRADIVEVSWVLAGSVPETEVMLRGEDVIDAEDAASITAKPSARGMLALAVAASNAREVLR